MAVLFMDIHWLGNMRMPAVQKVGVIGKVGILPHELPLGSSRPPKSKYRQGPVLISRLPQYLKEQDAHQMTT